MRSFRVLGPVEVWVDDRRVALGGGRQLKLLACLVLHANRAVSADALIDAVWGPQRNGAIKRLHMAIARLRKALDPLDSDDGSILRTVGGGYLLAVAAGELDADTFGEQVLAGRRALEDGDLVRASELLCGALALWRGPPLAEVAFEDFAQTEIRRLEEVRLSALEARIDADLRLGRHRELIGDLEILVAEQPTREHFAAQLMTALYRSDRQADALDVYQRIRVELAEQLGLEPGPRLIALQTQILEHAPTLSTARSLLESREPTTNLPAVTSSFVGRARELDDLRELVSGSRVVTLTGSGGVGKTRLALHLAADILEGSGDGVWFVDLAPLSDPDLVASKTAGVLGVREDPGRGVQESLVGALRPRKLLVVLDNCEHVIGEAAALVDALAKGCPQVSILATSREPLRVSGEHVYRVPSLSMPVDDDADTLAESEAVRLFLERAAEQESGVALDADNAAIVGRLCRRLDGIPLAIELAAARLRSMSLEDLDRRLDRRLRLLTGGSRTALPRQQTLEALIDWSYHLLNPLEQDLLARLSVFAGGFDLDAAEAVAAWGRGASMDVLDGLTALVDKSLVETDRSTVFRYRLLETVRQYGAAKLLDRGEDVVRAGQAAHRDHYLAGFETTASRFVEHGQVGWLDRVELELDNVRAALAYSLEDPDPVPALQLCTAMCEFWLFRRSTAEGPTSARAAVDRPDARAPTPIRGFALVAAALLLTTISLEHDAATVRAEEALAIARNIGDAYLEADALHVLAWINVRRGNDELVLELTDEGLRIAAPLGDAQLRARLLNLRAASPRLSHGERVANCEECLALYANAGNEAMRGRVLANLAYLNMEAGEFAVARRRIQETMRVFREIGDQRGVALGMCNLGFASYLDGATDEAESLFNELLRTAHRDGDLGMLAYAQLGLALVASRSGDAEGAAGLHGAADAIHDRLGTRVEGLESHVRDADTADLRSRLGDVAFEAAYSAGRDESVPALSAPA